MKYHIAVVLAAALVLLSCNLGGTAPDNRRFNASLKYGVNARNELNTFQNSFTKDLILDGSVTTRMVLSSAELDSLQARFLNIDIFSYPDTFVAQHSDTAALVTPHRTYVLRLTCNDRKMMLYWEDTLISSDPRAASLRTVFEYVCTLVEGKPEYKSLPPARGTYL